MDIAIDMAVVIHTTNHTFIFSKSETWFDDVIYINCDRDFDDICPIQSVVNMWNNDGETTISVDKTISTL